jgi:hypothetical protein
MVIVIACRPGQFKENSCRDVSSFPHHDGHLRFIQFYASNDVRRGTRQRIGPAFAAAGQQQRTERGGKTVQMFFHGSLLG